MVRRTRAARIFRRSGCRTVTGMPAVVAGDTRAADPYGADAISTPPGRGGPSDLISNGEVVRGSGERDGHAPDIHMRRVALAIRPTGDAARSPGAGHHPGGARRAPGQAHLIVYALGVALLIAASVATMATTQSAAGTGRTHRRDSALRLTERAATPTSGRELRVPGSGCLKTAGGPRCA